ncbi:MAG: hypothetical protein ACM30E_04090 [Nitrososphaerales archaeon]
MKPIRLLGLGLVPPIRSQTIYHALVECFTRVYQQLSIEAPGVEPQHLAAVVLAAADAGG